MVGSIGLLAGKRWWGATLAGVALVGLAGAGRAALAEEAAPLDRVLEGLQIKGRAVPAAPFVQQGRPAGEKAFIPVGTVHKDRPLKTMTPAEVAAAEADLDAVRERQQRRAGHTPAVVPLKTAKGAGVGKNTGR